jgi:hypothetical protein
MFPGFSTGAAIAEDLMKPLQLMQELVDIAGRQVSLGHGASLACRATRWEHILPPVA